MPDSNNDHIVNIEETDGVEEGAAPAAPGDQEEVVQVVTAPAANTNPPTVPSSTGYSRLRPGIPSAMSAMAGGGLFLIGGSWLLIILIMAAVYGASNFVAERINRRGTTTENRVVLPSTSSSAVPLDLSPARESNAIVGARAASIIISTLASGVYAFVLTEGGVVLFLLGTAGFSSVLSSLIANHGRAISGRLGANNVGRGILDRIASVGQRVNQNVNIERFFDRQIEGALVPSYGNPTRPSEAVLRGDLQSSGITIFSTIVGGVTMLVFWPASGPIFAAFSGLVVFGSSRGMLDFWSHFVRRAQARATLERQIAAVIDNNPISAELRDLRNRVVFNFGMQHPRRMQEIINGANIDPHSNNYAELVMQALVEASANNEELQGLLRTVILRVLRENAGFAQELVEAVAYMHRGHLGDYLARIANVIPPFLSFAVRLPLALILRGVPERARAPLEAVLAVTLFRSGDELRVAIQAVQDDVSPENVQNYVIDHGLFYPILRVLIYSLINLSVSVAIPWTVLTGLLGSSSVINVSFGVGGAIWGIVSSVLIYVKLSSVDTLVIKILPKSMTERDSVKIFFGHSEGVTRAERQTEAENQALVRNVLDIFREVLPTDLRQVITDARIDPNSPRIEELPDDDQVENAPQVTAPLPSDEQIEVAPNHHQVDEGRASERDVIIDIPVADSPMAAQVSTTYGTMSLVSASASASSGRRVAFTPQENVADGAENDSTGSPSISDDNVGAVAGSGESESDDMSTSPLPDRDNNTRLHVVSYDESNFPYSLSQNLNYSMFFYDNTPKTLTLISFDDDDNDDDLDEYSEERQIFDPRENEVVNHYDPDREYEVKVKKNDKSKDSVREDYEQYVSQSILPDKDLYDPERDISFLHMEGYQASSLVTPIVGIALGVFYSHHNHHSSF